MQLKTKTLTGMVRPYHLIDRMLKSQGFRRSHNQPPVYKMKIKDAGSGLVYRLKIPTSSPRPHSDLKYLRFEPPSLELDKTLFKSNSSLPVIPDTIVSAANEKIEEVASYLRS
ncbi:hypothetical protein [Lihuaxuella thermophila]|uniref:YugN-like family protein n=1 Tax=Lihuaxuella thermophila TaxID=1173111 RepID=A0A1H8DI16_9BACL|nr:hypothetical protein [Lihuaxuella thermophila]SEN06929.1 hypothetical protein SAMN05444955_105192 [Lihuaxuella thermophila]